MSLSAAVSAQGWETLVFSFVTCLPRDMRLFVWWRYFAVITADWSFFIVILVFTAAY
jgi:hypothetical protein